MLLKTLILKLKTEFRRYQVDAINKEKINSKLYSIIGRHV